MNRKDRNRWKRRLSTSLSRLETQDIKTQPSLNLHEGLTNGDRLCKAFSSHPLFSSFLMVTGETGNSVLRQFLPNGSRFEGLPQQDCEFHFPTPMKGRKETGVGPMVKDTICLALFEWKQKTSPGRWIIPVPIIWILSCLLISLLMERIQKLEKSDRKMKIL